MCCSQNTYDFPNEDLPSLFLQHLKTKALGVPADVGTRDQRRRFSAALGDLNRQYFISIG